MGRGMARKEIECGDIAYTWVSTSEDPIVAIYQTLQHFFNVMNETFKSLTPSGSSETVVRTGREAGTSEMWFYSCGLSETIDCNSSVPVNVQVLLKIKFWVWLSWKGWESVKHCHMMKQIFRTSGGISILPIRSFSVFPSFRTMQTKCNCVV